MKALRCERAVGVGGVDRGGVRATEDTVKLKQKTHHSPFEDVLGDVSGLWGVPLNGVRVGLVS